MMLSQITHYLNEEGQAEFSAWLDSVRSMLVTYPGFVSLRAFSDPDDPTVRVILLEMETEEATRGWVQSPDKAGLLRRIHAWSLRPYEARRLRPHSFDPGAETRARPG